MQKRLKVMIAENSTEFSLECEKTLTSYGMEVILVEKDGNRLINAIKSQNPDVVLADVFMPHCDMIGVLDMTSKMESGNKPIVFAMCSFDNPLLESQTLERGAASSRFRLKCLQKELFSLPVFTVRHCLRILQRPSTTTNLK